MRESRMRMRLDNSSESDLVSIGGVEDGVDVLHVYRCQSAKRGESEEIQAYLEE